MSRIARMDEWLFVLTLALAAVATLVAGIYPAVRAMRAPPALQLKVG